MFALQFNIIARDMGAEKRSSTATATIAIQRNSGRPTFINVGQYDVAVSEGVSVLSAIVQVTAVDSDSADTPNGQIYYTILSPPEAQRLFEINTLTGNITARVSLTTASQDLYRVSG